MEYRVWYGGTWSAWQDISGSLPYTYHFSEDCLHYLEIRAYDCLGNEVVDNETFHGDSTPPTTTKTIIGPAHGEYVILSTVIQLHAVDTGTCAVGVDYLHYEIW